MQQKHVLDTVDFIEELFIDTFLNWWIIDNFTILYLQPNPKRVNFKPDVLSTNEPAGVNPGIFKKLRKALVWMNSMSETFWSYRIPKEIKIW